ncbi:MAG: ribonuclease III [Myxococcota bacterium]|nr:ribonuclease III [Myxococcota bacterium]
MSEVRTTVTPLEERLGYTFAEPSLLREAMTHSTYANENRDGGGHNERLEFVGDAVLDVLVAQQLFVAYPEAPEGELSRRRARVVRRDALAAQATALELEGELRVGQGQRTLEGGITKSLLADAYEALVGAVYLDGGFGAVEATFGEAMEASIERATDTLDFKTELQQRCHRVGASVPEYRVLEVEGPDHARVFTCGVWIDDMQRGVGKDTSKKSAEQIAAKQAMESLPEPSKTNDAKGEAS